VEPTALTKPKKPTSTDLARAIQTVGTNLQGLGTYTQGIARVTTSHAEALAILQNQAHLQQGRLNEVWHEQKRLETVQEQLFISHQSQIVQTSSIANDQRVQAAQVETLETRCQQLQRLTAEQAKRLERLEDNRFNLSHALAIALALITISLTLLIVATRKPSPTTSYVPPSQSHQGIA
jgi:hypothetical protein